MVVREEGRSPAAAGPEWALHFLLERGLLSHADFIYSAPAAEDVSISHNSFCVRVGGQPRWFLKRADPVRSHGRDLGMEAAVYRLAAFYPALAGVTPRCRLISSDGGLVVLEAVRGEPLSAALKWPLPLADARGWETSHECEGTVVENYEGQEIQKILRAYGEAVARVHQVRPARFGQPPWLLVALEPRWGDYPWLPRICADLLARLASSPDVQDAFRLARGRWRAVCLIHGDLRWANALLEERDGSAKVRLVDWELACVGDPAWDLGSLIADVTASAALSGTDLQAGGLTKLCEPLLAGYRSHNGDPRWTALLEDSVRLAGIRLVQTVIECGHVSDAEFQRAEVVLTPRMLSFLTQPHAAAGEMALS